MAYALSTSSGKDSFECPICLDIFYEPIEIPCGHSFCSSCIMSCLSKVSTSLCPVCRVTFNTVQLTENRTMKRLMDTNSAKCSKCNNMVIVSSLRNHRKTCTSSGLPSNPPRGLVSCSFTLGVITSRPAKRAVNRSTFNCPYCASANLDREGLIKHINSTHPNDDLKVVCPICVSMPWGNPNQKSIDFRQHINLRHKFNYDTFVDFSKDEESTFQQVIELSKRDM